MAETATSNHGKTTLNAEHAERAELPGISAIFAISAFNVVAVKGTNRAYDHVETFAQPAPEGYRRSHLAVRGERVTCAGFPDFSLSVDEIIP